MIGRQIAIGFGIAIILPLLIYYGVRTFSPPPRYQDYVVGRAFNPNATPEERQAAIETQRAQQRAYSDAQVQFSSHLFHVSAPLGYAAILAGGFMAVSAVGTGLIFGGIFSVVLGYFSYWEHIADWQRFVSLLIAAIILLFIAYHKVSKTNVSAMNP